MLRAETPQFGGVRLLQYLFPYNIDTRQVAWNSMQRVERCQHPQSPSGPLKSMFPKCVSSCWEEKEAQHISYMPTLLSWQRHEFPNQNLTMSSRTLHHRCIDGLSLWNPIWKFDTSNSERVRGNNPNAQRNAYTVPHHKDVLTMFLTSLKRYLLPANCMESFRTISLGGQVKATNTT